MFTRRDVSKLAAALGLAAATPGEAHLALARAKERARLPVPPPVAEAHAFGHDMHQPALYDPAAFPGEVLSLLKGPLDELVEYEAAEPRAAYYQARAAFLQAFPELDLERAMPFHDMDEAAHTWSIEAYYAGLEAGAALERVRHVLTKTPRACPRCWGVGSERRDGHRTMAGGPDPCPACGGRGLVGGEA